MIKLELNLVRENPQWLAVLEAYRKASEKLSGQTATGTPEPAGTPPEDSAAESREALTADEPVAQQNVRKTPWLQRLRQIEGMDPGQLSRAHGRMIAYGLLQCDLPSRSAGGPHRIALAGSVDPAAGPARSLQDRPVP